MTTHSEGVQAGLSGAGETAAPPLVTSVVEDGLGSPRRPSGSRVSPASRATPYLLLLPAIAATVLLLGYPLVKLVMLSFQRLNPFQLIQHQTVWTGFSNYTDQLNDPQFWNTALRSLIFTVVNVALIMLIGTLVGLLLNRLTKWMRLLLQVGLILAWAMPIVASTTVFQWLFDSQFGVVDWFLSKLGWPHMAHFNWFSTQLSTFTVIILLIVWASIPFVAFNMYAGLTTIPSELYEAARMDGAGGLRIFRAVIFPSLKPFFLSTTFLEIIWVFKCFTQVFAIDQGGPDRSTETLPVYAYVVGVGNQHYGSGAAIAVLTILILLALMAYYFRIILKQEDEL